MRRFSQPFRHLQGKLTLSYTLTSIMVMVLLLGGVLTVGLAFLLSGSKASSSYFPSTPSRSEGIHLLASYFPFIILAAIILMIASLSGLISGYLTAHSLIRRLKNLSAATECWGHGDFSVLTYDASDDELGQMSRQLNRMAMQLRDLLSVGQKLATLEERHRLARDLHDSVKQQVFAIAMQVGAAQALFRDKPATTEAHLKEAQHLVNLVQQELASLINELRPAALEGKDLVPALRELMTRWTRHAGIVATLSAESHEILPSAVEEALFRIVQEALSNVTRHSKATLVQVHLTTTIDTVTLSITDNGQGFDPIRHHDAGFGLLSMQERMKALGGDMQLESAPGQGTRIAVQCQHLSSYAQNGANRATACKITSPIMREMSSGESRVGTNNLAPHSHEDTEHL